MGKAIESDALDRVYRVLGLSGGSGVKGTILDDGNVSQVLTVNELVRRSRTSASSSGWFFTIFQNVHAAAGPLTSSIDPYEPGTNAIPPFPRVVPRGFDIWILRAALRRTAGAGGLDGAVFSYNGGTSQQAWGVDDGGGGVQSQDPIPFALFTAIDASTSSPVGVSGTGQVSVPVNLRLPQGIVNVTLRTDAAAAATFRGYLTLGLFPEGLGQDVAQ